MKFQSFSHGKVATARRCALRLGLAVALLAGAVLMGLNPAPAQAANLNPSDLNLGNLTQYLLVFTNGSQDANWQSDTKGFVGNLAVDGLQASLRTSGSVPYAGNIYTNAATLDNYTDPKKSYTGLGEHRHTKYRPQRHHHSGFCLL
jgi:hypothetical protein